MESAVNQVPVANTPRSGTDLRWTLIGLLALFAASALAAGPAPRAGLVPLSNQSNKARPRSAGLHSAAMTNAISVLLLVVFLVHLVGFSILGLKRREWYYLALVTTFGLLSAAFATILFAPHVQVGQLPLHRVLRYAAWAAAAVSISWTVIRVLRKTRR